jgi:rhodanese-related sulfurtransferase
MDGTMLRFFHRAFRAGVLVAVLACGGRDDADLLSLEARIRAEFPDVPQLSTAELAAWLADPVRPQPWLIDARSREEYKVSHLPGAIPAATVAEVEEATGGDHARSLVLYCSVGYRSSALAARLQAAGYTHVYNLEGSIFRWANEGRPVFRGGDQVRQVHPYDASWGRYLDRSLWSFGE